ncbi:hypothetical protein K438DRAFT_1971075 [Mycena galopus ATCC 62051]|nr:hypothetical protein K438DRAFT_1971075 [Mycena galopus ATCC 62051]
MRWAEEVDLLEEEMRCILEFLRWRSDWWQRRENSRGLTEGPQLEGETAYATRQAAVQATLAREFMEEWKGLAHRIQRGRAGEDIDDVEEADVSEGEEEDATADAADDIEEEEEPIATLPQRTLKPTYVDEVLIM